MSDVSNSIRLNDYMSSTLRTINQTMEQTIGIMQRLDTQLRALGSINDGGFSGMETAISAVMNKIMQLEARIASIGVGAGPDGAAFAGLNTQLTAAQANTATLQERTGQLEDQTERLGHRARNTGEQFGGWAQKLTGVFSALQKVKTGLDALGRVTDIADEFTNANARVSLINDGLRTQAQLQQQVLDAANNTRTSYTATAALVARVGRSGAFRGDNDSAIRFADILNKSLILSGSGTAEASSVITQLTQAMSSGVLRGEAFNAIMENGSRLAEALATELGVTTGGLRQMAMDGQLTAEVVADAIMRAGETIDAEFGKMPRTFGQNMEIMRNVMGTWLADMAKTEGALGKINQLFTDFIGFILKNSAVFDGISAALFVVVRVIEMIAGGLGYLMEIIDALGLVFDAVVNAIIIILLVQAAVAIAGFIAGIIGGIYWATLLGQTIAFLTSPIFLVAAAIGIVIAALNHFGFTANDMLTFIGSLFGGLVALVGNVGIFFINTFMVIGEFLANVFINPIYAVQLLFYHMVENILGFFNGLIGGMVDGLKWLINKANGVADLDINNIDGFNIENPLREPTSDRETIANDRLNYLSYNDLAGKGADFATGFLRKIGDEAIPGMGMMPTPADIGSVDRVGRVGKIDDDVNIADEDMKMLMELAIQNRVNQINLTVQTTNSPNVTQNNVINTELDLQTAVNEITTGVYESNQVTVEQDY